MFRRIVLHIEFSQKEFKMIPSVFANHFSLRYKVGEDFFYLGKVTSCNWQGPKKVVMTLEIRKDETPVWYLRRIIVEARQEEIVIVKNSKVVCKAGHVARVENLDDALDTDMVGSLEAWVTPKGITH